MGIGFTITLLLMGTIREIIGSGTFFGIQVLPSMYPGYYHLPAASGWVLCIWHFDGDYESYYPQKRR